MFCAAASRGELRKGRTPTIVGLEEGLNIWYGNSEANFGKKFELRELFDKQRLPKLIACHE
jgi:hypothetical protein